MNFECFDFAPLDGRPSTYSARARDVRRSRNDNWNAERSLGGARRKHEFMYLPCKRLNCFLSRWGNQKSYKSSSAFRQSSWRLQRWCLQRSIDWSRRCRRTSAWRVRSALGWRVADDATHWQRISVAPSTAAGRSSASRSPTRDTSAEAYRWGFPGCVSTCTRPRIARTTAPDLVWRHARVRRRCKVLSCESTTKCELKWWIRTKAFALIRRRKRFILGLCYRSSWKSLLWRESGEKLKSSHCRLNECHQVN